ANQSVTPGAYTTLSDLLAGKEDRTLGEPIDQRSFYKIFCSAQRAIGIRIRDLYATKDTYVSTATDSRSQPRVAFRAAGSVGCDSSSTLWEVHPRRRGGRSGALENRLPRFRIGAVCPSEG